MVPPTPPHAVAVDVVAARPTDADEAVIARLSHEAGREVEQVAYLVKVRLQTVPPATSAGWALYVGDFRVPKYWQYEHGIYFKLYDPRFVADHAGEPLRFSSNGTEFIETGLTLATPEGLSPSTDVRDLPHQSDVLG
jgi:hypothetical protein